MYVWVDAANPTLAVLDSSSDFAFLAGMQGPCSALSEWLSSSDLRSVRDRIQHPDKRSVDVRLIMESKWSYKCVLSIDDEQEVPATQPSSKPVCLVADRLVLELWASLSDGEQIRITRVEGGSSELANAFSAEPDLMCRG